MLDLARCKGEQKGQLLLSELIPSTELHLGINLYCFIQVHSLVKLKVFWLGDRSWVIEVLEQGLLLMRGCPVIISSLYLQGEGRRYEWQDSARQNSFPSGEFVSFSWVEPGEWFLPLLSLADLLCVLRAICLASLNFRFWPCHSQVWWWFVANEETEMDCVIEQVLVEMSAQFSN